MGSVPRRQERLKQCWWIVLTYLISWGTHSMFGVLEVKGEATDASCSDKEMPTWAIFKAWKQRVSLWFMHTHIHLSWGLIRKGSVKLSTGGLWAQTLPRRWPQTLFCLSHKKEMVLGHPVKEIGTSEPNSTPFSLYWPLSYYIALVKTLPNVQHQFLQQE